MKKIRCVELPCSLQLDVGMVGKLPYDFLMRGHFWAEACLLQSRRISVVLPHVIVSSSAALVRVRVIVVALPATLAQVDLSVCNAITATTTPIRVVLRVVRIARTLIVCIAMLVLSMVTILLRLS